MIVSRYELISICGQPACWYQVLRLSDLDLFLDDCRRVAIDRFREAFNQKHEQLVNPVYLCIARATAIFTHLIEGRTVYVNRNGGWCMNNSERWQVVERYEGETFPAEAAQSFYIKKFGGGRHFHLYHEKPKNAWLAKFDTLEMANDFLKRNFPKGKLTYVDECAVHIYLTEGD